MANKRQDRDSGFASLWAIGVLGVLMVFLLCGVYLAGVIAARHRAASTADLMALAAATQRAAGDEDACVRARWVADQLVNGSVNCRIDGDDALVEVSITLPGWWRMIGTVNARARAGPIDPESTEQPVPASG